MKTVRHQAPTLSSELIGEYDEENRLVLFRGIPYATVEKRWTHSKTRHDLTSQFDATSFGPRCVQADGEVLVSGGINDPVPGDDEFGCLNLNIAIPDSILTSNNKQLVPVMVWIHGGAFHYGANSVARYRPSKICSIAAVNGTPIILVSIGYRLGPLGFAASDDLVSEDSMTNGNIVNGDCDPSTGSYGFIDQRNALQWVRDHISDFGGDPTNVTAFGVSAGSASVHFHILTGEPLFDRAIMMSGAASTLGPLPFHYYQKAWADMCKTLHMTESSPEIRLERLRSFKPEQIIASYSKAAMGPCGDGSFLPSEWTFQDAAQTRCKSIILGDTRVEAIILDGLFKSIPQATFQEIIRSILHPDDAAGFAKAFGFSFDDQMPQEKYIEAMRHFFSVMMFQYPNIGLADANDSICDTYMYHFEEPSPYPGPTHGVPYHGQCALYMHNNDIEAYPPSGKRVAQEMATIWTAFAHGVQPWEPYSKLHRFMRFGPGASSTIQSFETDQSRDYQYFDWLKNHWEPAKLIARHVLQGEGKKS